MVNFRWTKPWTTQYSATGLSCDATTRLAHEVGDARLFVVVELEEALAPLLPVEVLDLLELLQVAQLVLEAAVALPRHHPHVPPLVPQRLRARVLDALLLLRD